MDQRHRQRSSLRIVYAALVSLFALLLNSCMGGTAHETLPIWSVPPVPPTAAGQQFDAYLTTFNKGDREALKHFVAEHFTPIGPGGSDINARISSQLQLYDASHGLNLYQIEESHDTAITVTAQLRLTQEWKRMTFMVEDAAPHLVAGIMMVPIDTPVITTSVAQNDEQLRQQIDMYMQGLVAADRFSGVVLVAKNGTSIFQHAYGMADKEQGISNELSTHFDIGSVGKMFTAVAIAQLAENGKLAFDAPISTYLPEYPAAIAQQVTIDQLLTHRSGIVDCFADLKRIKPVLNSRDPQRDYLALFMDEPLRFTPGTRFEYSNSNYILLGAIIERVSGERYADYVQKHIFAPAGMNETSVTGEGIESTLRAHRYTEVSDDEVLQPGDRHLGDHLAPAVGSAAGGSYAAAADLLAFDRALRTNKLLTPDSTRLLLTDRVDYARPGYRYGYDVIFRKTGNEQIAGHSGGFPGVDAQFDMYLYSGYTVIALANYEAVAEPVVMHIQHLLG